MVGFVVELDKVATTDPDPSGVVMISVVGVVETSTRSCGHSRGRGMAVAELPVASASPLDRV